MTGTRRVIAWLVVVALAGGGCGTRVAGSQNPGASLPAAGQAQVTTTGDPVVPPASAPPLDAAPRRAASNAEEIVDAPSTPAPMAPVGAPAHEVAPRPRSAPGMAAGSPSPPPPRRVEPATPASSALRPSARPIAIGNVGTYSGVAGEPWSKQRDAVQVWAAQTNAAGGLRGSPVRIISADDGGDFARHRALVRELVERRKVIAFVGNAEAITGAASVDYLTEVRVPVIGSEGGGDYFYTSSMHFPQQVHGDRWVYIALAAAATQGTARGLHRLGTLTCVEVNVCEQAHRMAAAVAGEHGMEVVWQQRAALTQPDFTAECLAARRAGVETLLVGMDPNSVVRVAGSCSRQEYRPMYATNGGVASDALLRVPTLDGIAIGSGVYPYTQTDLPAVAELHAAMRRYAPGASVDMNHAVGWAAAKLFEQAASRVTAPLSPAALLDGLWTIRDDDLGGLTYPLTFHPEGPAPRVTCWWNMTIRDGRYDVFRDTRRLCASAIGEESQWQ